MKNRKWIFLVVIIVGLLFLFKACTGQATKELVKSVSLHRVESSSFRPVYETMSTVIAKNDTRYPIEGLLVKYYVRLGEKVKKGDKLFKFSSMGKELVVKSKNSGIVSELNEGYVAIADGTMQLQFDLPQQYVTNASINQTIQLSNETGTWQGEIIEISNVAVNKNGVEYYLVYVDVSNQSTLRLGMEVDIKLTMSEVANVVMVPVMATIQLNGKIYVIKKSWLEHPLELLPEDYAVIEVLGTNDSMIVVENTELRDVDICVFSGISSDFIKELVKGL